MKKDNLSDLSMQLSVDVLKLTKELRAKHETVISNQIGRSATSVFANISEAQYPQSLPDMLSKFEIARKECMETESWLKLLLSSSDIDDLAFKRYRNICGRIRRMLTSSCITIENKINKKSRECSRLIFVSEGYC